MVSVQLGLVFNSLNGKIFNYWSPRSLGALFVSGEFRLFKITGQNRKGFGGGWFVSVS